ATDYTCPSTLLRTSLPKYTYFGLRFPDLDLGLPCPSSLAWVFLAQAQLQEISLCSSTTARDFF
ncbi:hypothetical protein A2U01_0103470, partial [Trifolium medium]|nr:hypothetical protein [Trifolium medium]